MGRLVKGDVVVIDFPFSNLKDSKRRPVLIIKVPSGDDVLVSQITGSSYEKSMEVALGKKDFEKGDLKRRSYVRIDKIATIEKHLIKYKIGSLKSKKFNEILDSIINFLKG